MAALRLVLLFLLLNIHNEVIAESDVDVSMMSELMQANRELMKANRELIKANKELMKEKRELIHTNRDIQSSVKEMGDRIVNMEHKNKILEERLAVIENSGEEKPCPHNSTFNHQDRRLVMTSGEPVAFLASLNAPAREEHLGVNQNIQFDTVTTNLGGAFNVNHGIFTVPKSGVYLISATVMSRKDGEVRACIMVNGKRTVTTFGHGSIGRPEQGTQVAVLQLQTGDTVTVQNIDLPDIAIWGDRYTSFTGVLLYEME